MNLLEVLNGESIDGSPEGAEHGDGEKKKENEGNRDDESTVWSLKVGVRIEETVLEFCIVEWEQKGGIRLVNGEWFWFSFFFFFFCLVRKW